MKFEIFKNKVYDSFRSLKYCILVKLYPSQYLAIRASVEMDNGHLRNCNWGDDLNLVLTSFLTRKKVLVLPNNRLTELLRVPNYLVIGSILIFYPLKDAVVWGSGIINDRQSDKITAVILRGSWLCLFRINGKRYIDLWVQHILTSRVDISYENRTAY